MLNEIETKFGLYEFRDFNFGVRQKFIDLDVSKKNLFEICDFFEGKGFDFGLIYGTLLGVYRDGQLISWDEDTDIYLLDGFRHALIDSLFELRAKGFELVRCDGDLLSLMKYDEYTDIYIFSEKSGGYFKCNLDVIPSRFFSSTSFVTFDGRKLPTVCDVEGFLIYAYGEDWVVPKRNAPANVKGRLGRFYKIFKPFIPKVFVNIAKKIMYKR